MSEIEKRMLELRMTPDELAAKAGFSIATAYNLLSGKPVNRRTLLKAADALKLSPTELAEILLPTSNAAGGSPPVAS